MGIDAKSETPCPLSEGLVGYCNGETCNIELVLCNARPLSLHTTSVEWPQLTYRLGLHIVMIEKTKLAH